MPTPRPEPVEVGSPEPEAPATVTIANGASLSGAADLGRHRLHRIIMPAAWTAASITFEVSYDGTSYNALYLDSGEYTIGSSVAGASRSIVVDQAAFYGVRCVKVRSGTSSAGVNQGAARDITLVTVPR